MYVFLMILVLYIFYISDVEVSVLESILHIIFLPTELNFGELEY
jgi:hypothetical protein